MTAEIRTDADVFILQEELADFEPCESVQVIPEELRGSSKSLICFTSAMNGNLASAEQIISQCPNTMIISSYASSLPVITSNQWVLSEGFELNKA